MKAKKEIMQRLVLSSMGYNIYLKGRKEAIKEILELIDKTNNEISSSEQPEFSWACDNLRAKISKMSK